MVEVPGALESLLVEESGQREHLVALAEGSGESWTLRAVHLTPIEALLGLSPPASVIERRVEREGVTVDYRSHEIGVALSGVAADKIEFFELLLAPDPLLASPALGAIQATVRRYLSRRLADSHRGRVEGLLAGGLALAALPAEPPGPEALGSLLRGLRAAGGRPAGGGPGDGRAGGGRPVGGGPVGGASEGAGASRIDEVLAANRAEPRGHGGVDTARALQRIAGAKDELIEAFWRGARGDDGRCVEIALALDPLLVLASPPDEHQRLLDQALLIATRAGDREAQADLMIASARIWAVRGAYNVGLVTFQDAAALVDPGDMARLGALHGLRAYMLVGQRRGEEAEVASAQAVRCAEQVVDPPIRLRLMAFACQGLGIAAEVRGDGPVCRQHLDEAAAYARAAKAERMLALILANLGLARTVTLERPEREAFLAESMALFMSLGDTVHAIRLRAEVALLPGGEVEQRGVGVLLPLLDEARALSCVELEATLLLTLAERALAGGDAAQARSLASSVLPLCLKIDGPGAEARLVALLSRLDGRPATPQGELRVSASGKRVSFGELRLDLGSRRALPRVMLALARARLDGLAGLDVQALFAAGWPGERASPSSAAARVYMAVRTLRQLGLGQALKTLDNIYLIEPSLGVILESL